MIVRAVIEVAISIAALWAVFVAVLFLIRPDDGLARESMRVLPDTLRLVRRLAADRTLGTGIRCDCGCSSATYFCPSI